MTAGAPSAPVRSRDAEPLGRRDVRLLVAGQAASELGSQVGSIALPLVAVLALGVSPFEIGVLTAAGTISFAVLALPAGVWVDRLPRRPVLVGADLVRGAALLTVPVAAGLQQLSRFLVFGALPLGGLLGGLAGERLGVRPTLWLVGIGLTMTPVPLLVSPCAGRRANLARSDENDGHAPNSTRPGRAPAARPAGRRLLGG